MAYKLNGVTLTRQPTTGKWIPQTSLDDDGAGHPIYPTVREFELKWGLLSPGEFRQLYNVWAAQGTGTVITTLPCFASGVYVFNDYTGTIVRQPEVSEYYQEYLLNVTMVVTNVST